MQRLAPCVKSANYSEDIILLLAEYFLAFDEHLIKCYKASMLVVDI